MRKKQRTIHLAMWAFILSSFAETALAEQDLFPTFADRHTVALWLFDDPEYLNATLTDASVNYYDLRLQPGGKLVPGRFGGALGISKDRTGTADAARRTALRHSADGVDPLRAVSFARTPRHGDFGGGKIVPPEKLLATLRRGDWTWEFWFKLDSPPKTTAPIVAVDAQAFYCGLTEQAKALVVRSRLAQSEGRFPLDPTRLAHGRWHHIAVTCEAKGKQLSCFVDGRRLPASLTKDGSPYPEPAGEFDFRLLSVPLRDAPCHGTLDEMRVSDAVRYTGEFAVPGSFSRNFGKRPPRPAEPTGPPLLFSPGAPPGPVKLGSRKHLFIDDALLEETSNVRLNANPPPRSAYQVVDFTPKPWEGGGAGGTEGLGLRCVYEYEGKMRFMVTNGAFWRTPDRPTTQCLLTSADGVHLERPNVGLYEWNGSRENNIVMFDLPTQGTFFVDPRPKVPPEERLKYTGLLYNRGVYVFVSPDGVHWRRNEVAALPLDHGGGTETFWDEQRGTFVIYMRAHNLPSWREPPPERPAPANRFAGVAETRELLRPWPFTRLENPTAFKDSILPLLSGPPSELPLPFVPNENGEVYRTRVVKYRWAPDAYLAFVWRLTIAGPGRANEWRQTELATSRDGVRWRFYGMDPPYMPAGGQFRGSNVRESLSVHGSVRRGDEIWQYAVLKGKGHTMQSDQDRIVRMIQRLDGFVSLDGGEQAAKATTVPLVFAGDRLVLNIHAKGAARVALLDRRGNEIPGFGLAQCDPIRGDSVRHTVHWNGKPGVGHLAGKTIRLRFELKNAKLYALQFVSDEQGALR